MIKIHNSFTKQKQEFIPLEPGKIKLYVCGITVYDYCHIGHARTTLAFDMMVRYWQYRGFDVTYVRNITDIDDKIIKRAAENQQTCEQLTEHFIAAMHEDFDALGIARPHHEPRATAHIPSIINMIARLIDNQHAYIADNGDVYFAVNQYKAYGQLSHQNLAALQSGVRVEVGESKRDPLDFVLWKKAKPGEPSWPSPFGVGRPGWHIECSAMSTECLGDTFDVHGGGHDLLFPHHENERAQAEGCTGKPFVNYWLHVGFVQVDDEKMSKSLGNFFTIRDILKTIDAESLRYFLLASHYRSPINFSDVALKQARASLTTLYTALRDVTPSMALQNTEYHTAFSAAMDDDFNTPLAISVLFTLANEVNRLAKTDFVRARQLSRTLKELGDVLGLLQQDARAFFQGDTKDSTAIALIEQLIAERNKARQEKNWVVADSCRDKLLAMGVILEDSAEGTSWRRE